MVGRDALLELDLGLDVVDGVAELYLKGQGDGLYLTEPQGLDEDLVDTKSILHEESTKRPWCEDLRGLKAVALVLHCMGVQCATLFGGPVCTAGFSRLVLTSTQHAFPA